MLLRLNCTKCGEFHEYEVEQFDVYRHKNIPLELERVKA